MTTQKKTTRVHARVHARVRARAAHRSIRDARDRRQLRSEPTHTRTHTHVRPSPTHTLTHRTEQRQRDANRAHSLRFACVRVFVCRVCVRAHDACDYFIMSSSAHRRAKRAPLRMVCGIIIIVIIICTVSQSSSAARTSNRLRTARALARVCVWVEQTLAVFVVVGCSCSAVAAIVAPCLLQRRLFWRPFRQRERARAISFRPARTHEERNTHSGAGNLFTHTHTHAYKYLTSSHV